jgi:hypothetical protein
MRSGVMHILTQVSPSSRIRASTVFLLVLMQNENSRLCALLQPNNIHVEFRENRSCGSEFEILPAQDYDLEKLFQTMAVLSSLRHIIVEIKNHDRPI